MDEKWNEIRKRADAATPGPWKKDIVDHALETAKTLGVIIVIHSESQWDRDMDFIAHARQDVPDLLAALDAAEQDREKFIDAGVNEHYRWLEAKRRVTETEAQLAECKDKLLAVVATDEWHMVGGNYGDEECPFCNANRAYGDEHNSDCSRQAAAEWLERQDSPK